MKKKTALILGAILVTAAAIGCLLLRHPPTQEEPKGVSIYDSTGALLLHAVSQSDVYESPQWSYLDTALTQTAAILVEQTGCQPEEAVGKLFSEGYQIYTYFDRRLYQKVSSALDQWTGDTGTACALTDLNGRLLVTYSTREQQTNHANRQIPPYSAFKVLSVYTPAVESGMIQWSTLYHDSPYKMLGDTGWPANANGSYSQKDVTVYDGLRKSLNTVAVKCLAQLGIDTSLDFLRQKLGIPMEEEAYIAETYGDEEVIGNIALGYLEKGLTPVDMAGYYQIFATGGLYTQPSAVDKILSETGEPVYTREAEASQVISPATADTMNRLLRGVVAPGGTGAQIRIQDVAIAGKTGTGDGYSDSWFVGVTPGYSCAVWHGQHTENQAASLFAGIIQSLYENDPTAVRNFITHQTLQEIVYCAKSGMAISPACTSIGTGYFVDPHSLGECTICNTQETGGTTP